MKVVKFVLLTIALSFVTNGFSQDLIPNSKPKSQFDVNYSTEQKDATYNGGVDAMVAFITQNIVLPEKKEGKRADVLIKVTIGADGAVGNVEMMQGVNAEVDKAFIEAVKKMPKWIPGTINGQPIEVEQIIGCEVTY